MFYRDSPTGMKSDAYRGVQHALGAGLRILALLCAPVLYGATIYTYTGNPFETVVGPYTTSDYVRGFFVSDTLGPNLVEYDIRPIIFDFTDGHRRFIRGGGKVWTDEHGDIEYWKISLFEPICYRFCIYLETMNYPEGSLSIAMDRGGYDSWGTPWEGGSILDSPGRWSRADFSTPEPSSLILVAIPLLVGLLMARTRVREGIRR